MGYTTWWDSDLDRSKERYECDAPDCDNEWEGRYLWGMPDGWYEVLYGSAKSNTDLIDSSVVCSTECLSKWAALAKQEEKGNEDAGSEDNN